MEVGDLVRSKHYGLGIVTMSRPKSALCLVRFFGFCGWFYFTSVELLSKG